MKLSSISPLQRTRNYCNLPASYSTKEPPASNIRSLKQKLWEIFEWRLTPEVRTVTNLVDMMMID
jgi:hypothetical protein